MHMYYFINKNTASIEISINSFNIICPDLETICYFGYLKILADNFLFLFTYCRL